MTVSIVAFQLLKWLMLSLIIPCLLFVTKIRDGWYQKFHVTIYHERNYHNNRYYHDVIMDLQKPSLTAHLEICIWIILFNSRRKEATCPTFSAYLYLCFSAYLLQFTNSYMDSCMAKLPAILDSLFSRLVNTTAHQLGWWVEDGVAGVLIQNFIVSNANRGHLERHKSQNVTKSMANVTSKSGGDSQLVAYLAWQVAASSHLRPTEHPWISGRPQKQARI